jgi:cytochrome c556
MRYRFLSSVVVTVLAAGFVAPAFAQPKPDALVSFRQSAMRLQLKYLVPLVQMARNRIPFDAAVATRNAGFVDTLLKMPWDDFQQTTEGVKSRALPAVYQERDRFKAAQEAAQAEAAKLASAAKGGDEAAIKAAALSLNDACNSCHDKFREKQ